MRWPSDRATRPLKLSPEDQWDAESVGRRILRGVEALFEEEGWVLTDEGVEQMTHDPEPSDPYAIRLLDFLADCLIVTNESDLTPADQVALFTQEAQKE